jgi:DNA polymerase-1
VRTYFGRVRPIPDIQSRNPNMRGFAERTAINTPLQGTAADLIKLAMLAHRRRDRRAQTALPHDPAGPRRTPLRRRPRRSRRAAHTGQHEMEHVAEFSVPIVAEVGLGPNWRDIK